MNRIIWTEADDDKTDGKEYWINILMCFLYQ